MPSGKVTERQCRSERDAGPGIGATHDRVHVVAAGVEARDRPTILANHRAVDVGVEADGRAEIRHAQTHGIEWWRGDRRDAGIRNLIGVAEMPLINVAAAAEPRVYSSLRVGVEIRNRLH